MGNDDPTDTYWQIVMFLYCDNTVMATNRLDLPPAKVKTVDCVCAEYVHSSIVIHIPKGENETYTI